jgi:hypothetical protein
MSYLLGAKRNLAERATEVYNDMRHDVAFDEYGSHFSRLGETLANIDKTESFGELLQKIMKGDFEHIGLFTDDEDMLEEFLRDIFKK